MKLRLDIKADVERENKLWREVKEGKRGVQVFQYATSIIVEPEGRNGPIPHEYRLIKAGNSIIKEWTLIRAQIGELGKKQRELEAIMWSHGEPIKIKEGHNGNN